MCGCNAHWREDSECTCACPEHTHLRYPTLTEELLEGVRSAKHSFDDLQEACSQTLSRLAELRYARDKAFVKLQAARQALAEQATDQIEGVA